MAGEFKRRRHGPLQDVGGLCAAALNRFVDVDMNRNLMRGRTPGAKAPFFSCAERAKAEALAYLEAKTPLLDLVGVGGLAG